MYIYIFMFLSRNLELFFCCCFWVIVPLNGIVVIILEMAPIDAIQQKKVDQIN